MSETKVGHCASCAHWNTFGQRKRGTCEVLTSVSEGGYALLVDVDYGAERPQVELMTSKEFGCKLWEGGTCETD